MSVYELVSDYEPRGDQPRAIQELTEGVRRGDRYQTLLGVTGSGKTFTMANVIRNVGRPALIISHNKTLAAQLYGEFKSFFPRNAVEYFISYYDYYQPEAYLPTTDTYIEKDASINDEIDRLRLKATSSLLSRDDVVIVASVSCIYGLGSPEEYERLLCRIKTGEEVDRDRVLRRLIDIQYTRNDIDFARGTFRVRGDTLEIRPAYEDWAVRVEFFGDEVERISIIDILTGEVAGERDRVAIYPARHFVTTHPRIEAAVVSIREELAERLSELRAEDKLVEAQRLESRTNYDIEMLLEVGYCSGIENYSRHLAGRAAGDRPFTLLDYFPDNFLVFIDESHRALPQLQGMYRGDRSRKEMLVEHGFRLPSALDNRPLYFEEFESLVHQATFVSATPAEMELERSGGVVVEQIIRPTGLMEPEVVVRPAAGQVDDLIGEARERIKKGQRVLVTTLTKRMAEDLTDYLSGLKIRVRYLHSEIGALERVAILRDLRLGKFDVLVGINLLREGLDLPEVGLVAILDADKEGFLRSVRSLIQTSGRAARHVDGRVIMYADNLTGAMKEAMAETGRRRRKQIEYNKKHGITPESIVKSVEDVMKTTTVAMAKDEVAVPAEVAEAAAAMGLEARIEFLTKAMGEAAGSLEFEKAALLRDEIAYLRGEITEGLPPLSREALEKSAGDSSGFDYEY